MSRVSKGEVEKGPATHPLATSFCILQVVVCITEVWRLLDGIFCLPDFKETAAGLSQQTAYPDWHITWANNEGFADHQHHDRGAGVQPCRKHKWWCWIVHKGWLGNCKNNWNFHRTIHEVEWGNHLITCHHAAISTAFGSWWLPKYSTWQRVMRSPEQFFSRKNL